MEKRERRERFNRRARYNDTHKPHNVSKDKPTHTHTNTHTHQKNDKEPEPQKIKKPEEPIDHTAIPDPHMFDNLKRETDDIVALTTKKSSRQIFSNWSKYELPNEEEGGQEEEEEEDRIGADFNSLVHTLPVDNYFRFKSEQNWDTPTSSACSEVFNLNMSMLETCLSCIPFYEQLNISLDYFSKEEVERMDNHANLHTAMYQSKKKNFAKGKAKDTTSKIIVPSSEESITLYDTEEKQEDEKEDSQISFDMPEMSQPDEDFDESSKEDMINRREKTPDTFVKEKTPIRVIKPPRSSPAEDMINRREKTPDTFVKEKTPVREIKPSRSSPAEESTANFAQRKVEPNLSYSSPNQPVNEKRTSIINHEVDNVNDSMNYEKEPRRDNNKEMYSKDQSTEEPVFEEPKAEIAHKDSEVKKNKGKSNKGKTNKKRNSDPEKSDNSEKGKEISLEKPERKVKDVLPQKSESQVQNVQVKNQQPAMETKSQPAKIEEQTQQKKVPRIPEEFRVNSTSGLSSSKGSKSNKDDDQLDFLLSLKKPVKQEPLNFAKESNAVPSTLDDDDVQSPLPGITTTKKTEELENWLDSMLDD